MDYDTRMMQENHRPKVAVVMPYHNNLYDFLILLTEIASVYVITPRSFRKGTHMAPPVPTNKIYSAPRIGFITHAYNPFVLWKMITSDTTHVLIKHLHLAENIVPIIIAQLKGAKVIVMIQQLPSSRLGKILVKISSLYLKLIGAKFFSVTSQGTHNLKSSQYIPACIDVTRFQERKTIRPEDDTLRILSIGKYIRRKNFHLLIHAVRELISKYPKLNVQLTFVGPKSDSHLFEKLESQVVSDPALKNVVTLDTGVPPERIPALLPTYSLFILPAASEPLGYSVLEAMAAGLPVITTDEVGSSSYVQENKNGYIVPANSPQALFAAIDRFVDSHGNILWDKIQTFGEYSRTIVESSNTPKAIKATVINLLT